MRRWNSMGGGPVGTCAAGRAGAFGGGAALNEGGPLGRGCGFDAQADSPRPQPLLDCGIRVGLCARNPKPSALPGCGLGFEDGINGPPKSGPFSVWGLPHLDSASPPLTPTCALEPHFDCSSSPALVGLFCATSLIASATVSWLILRTGTPNAADLLATCTLE